DCSLCSPEIVSCPIDNIAFVAIKIGRRSGRCRTKAMLFMGPDTSGHATWSGWWYRGAATPGIALSFSSVSMAGDARLSEQDARLNHAYQQRVAQLSSNPQKLAELRRQELDWLKQRDQQCGKDMACLTAATKARADYLEQQVSQDAPKPP